MAYTVSQLMTDQTSGKPPHHGTVSVTKCEAITDWLMCVYTGMCVNFERLT